jgi:MFS family permease
MTADREPIRQSDPASHRQVSAEAIWLLGFMWFAYFLNYCDRQAVFAMFPSLKSDLGMTDQQLGLTGTVFLWVYALGCPVAGIIGDRVSKRILVVLSLIIWSLVTVTTGLARSGAELLWLRAAMGVSESLFMPTAIALTASAFAPALRSRTIAILTTAQIAGTVVGSWFGGWMADMGAWRTAFFALGGVGLVYAFPYFAFLRSLKLDGSTESAGAQSVGCSRTQNGRLELPVSARNDSDLSNSVHRFPGVRVWAVVIVWLAAYVLA